MAVEAEVELCFPHLNTSRLRPKSTGFSLLLTSTSFFTASLNLLVIISISHFRQLYTPTNILLLSLAITDFLIGLVSMPVELLQRTSCWYFGDVTCVLAIFSPLLLSSVSIGNILLISIDRYVAICDPLRYSSRVTHRRATVCVCLCWLCSVLYICLYLKDILSQPGRFSTRDGECTFQIDLAMGTVDLVLSFIIPITAIIVLYMRVFIVAASQARAMRSHVTAVNLQLSLAIPVKKSELKAARTLGILVMVFLICFLPSFYFSIVGDSGGHVPFGAFVIFVFYLNSCVNPLIYAMFYPWFRKAVRLIVTLQILQPGSREANVL
ncbi:trace amine-associated receptor 13c-like [Cheilinus undulatus]|uniref:trace amine-associated receptor 13c-like n=1 Tax=Cheilinus undulatus TaxID=241271 RepID=UPI001BD6643D|nr:trace amine-associated receptor 13c-like [Cheilinus undulatus]